MYNSFTVDGQWGKWGSWTDCSLSCRGMRQRTLQCDNPPPQNGGKDCEGKHEKDKTEKMLCDKKDCNGKFCVGNLIFGQSLRLKAKQPSCL